MDIEQKLQKALVLYKKRKFREMEQLCRKIIDNKPHNYKALHFLGIALSEQGNNTGAIHYYILAERVCANDPKLLYNIGVAYLKLEHIQKAISAFNKSIKINPNQADVFNNLGSALSLINKYDESKMAFENAIKLNSYHRPAINNLGICLKKMGLFKESVSEHLKAIELDPNSASEYTDLCRSLAFNHINEDVLNVAIEGLKVAVDNSQQKFELLIIIAIYSWLCGQLQITQEAIDQCPTSDQVITGNLKNINQSRTYKKYIETLLEIRSHHKTLYNGRPDKAMFFVGESHCISPSETVVEYFNESYRILSTIIIGCKSWHLGRKGDNEYKKSFEILFKSLPPQSKIIVGVGEIDCRIREGFYRAFKEEGIDFRSSIPDVVDKYVDFATYQAKKFSHTLIFYGVPSLRKERRSSLSIEQSTLLMEIISLFNKELRRACYVRGWKLLDVFQATQNNDKYHIDNYHLHPKVLRILFQNTLNHKQSSEK